MVRIDKHFLTNTFISNAKMKLAKSQPNAKQRPEAKLKLIDN